MQWPRFLFSVFFSCLLTPFAVSSQELPDRNLQLNIDKLINGCIERGLCADELAVGTESAKASTQVLRAWKLRDAKLFLGNQPSPLRDDVQRRMNTTTSIDYLKIEIEVESVKGNEAIVLSRQNFSRLLLLTDGKERRRITSVTHREVWDRVDKTWTLKKFTEQDPKAAWEDEKP